MSFFISHLHTDLRQARYTRRGATQQAKDVPTGRHKTYERMEKIILPEPQALNASLADVLNNRQSYQGGESGGVVPLEAWGTLLGLALRKREGATKRPYPSGGSLYPIETYIVSTAVPGHGATVFHYNPSLHVLEKLWNLPNSLCMEDLLSPKKSYFQFSTLIVLTGVWDRSCAKYGDFAYMLSLLEAGHMSENILLIATALELHTRPMMGFDDNRIQRLLDIDPEEEQPMQGIILNL